MVADYLEVLTLAQRSNFNLVPSQLTQVLGLAIRKTDQRRCNGDDGDRGRRLTVPRLRKASQEMIGRFRGIASFWSVTDAFRVPGDDPFPGDRHFPIMSASYSGTAFINLFQQIHNLWRYPDLGYRLVRQPEAEGSSQSRGQADPLFTAG